MSAPALVAAIANAVDDADLGVVGATQQMMTQFGVVVGIQVMQSTQASRVGAVGAEAAYSDAYLVGAAAALLGLVFACFVRSSVVRTRPDPDANVLSSRSEEHTSELQSLMRISFTGFCLKKKKRPNTL